MSGRSAELLRRRVPIMAYVGGNGGGKTLAMVHDTLASLNAGRTVLSTVELFSPSGRRHPSFIPLTSWRQLVDARNCDVLLDEVAGVASARAFAALPHQLLNVMGQLRRRDVQLRWTSPAYARADVGLREITRGVTLCRGYMPEAATEGPWPPRRLFTWTTYDAIDFDSFEAQQTDKLRRHARQIIWRGKSMAAQYAYRTLDEVLTLDHLDQFGSCLTCGGKRQVPRCTCDQSPTIAPRTRKSAPAHHYDTVTEALSLLDNVHAT